MAPISPQDTQECVQRIGTGAIVGASIGAFVAGFFLSLISIYFGRKLRKNKSDRDDSDASTTATIAVTVSKSSSEDEKLPVRTRPRRLSEGGWSWRENKFIPPFSLTDLSAQQSTNSSVTVYRHSPLSTPGQSVPSLPLPALLKERGLGSHQEITSVHGSISTPPSYQTSMHEGDSPLSLYSQASAAPDMHRRITVSPEGTPPIPMRHPLSRRTQSNSAEAGKDIKVGSDQKQKGKARPLSILKRSSGQAK